MNKSNNNTNIAMETMKTELTVKRPTKYEKLNS